MKNITKIAFLLIMFLSGCNFLYCDHVLQTSTREYNLSTKSRIDNAVQKVINNNDVFDYVQKISGKSFLNKDIKIVCIESSDFEKYLKKENLYSNINNNKWTMIATTIHNKIFILSDNLCKLTMIRNIDVEDIIYSVIPHELTHALQIQYLEEKNFLKCMRSPNNFRFIEQMELLAYYIGDSYARSYNKRFFHGIYSDSSMEQFRKNYQPDAYWENLIFLEKMNIFFYNQKERYEKNLFKN